MHEFKHITENQFSEMLYMYFSGLNEFVLMVLTALILGLHPANERRRYKVMPSLIGWAQT